MTALSVEDLLALLEIDRTLAEHLQNPPPGLSLGDLRPALEAHSGIEVGDTFAGGILEALDARYAAELGDVWTEARQDIALSLHVRWADLSDGCWGRLQERTRPLIALWGPPGAMIQYATEGGVLELVDSRDEASPTLFVILRYDERSWDGAPEIVGVHSSLAGAHAYIAESITHDLGDMIRGADPALTFRVTIPAEMLWTALDEVVGPSFGDWAKAFREAVGSRTWLERDFIVNRARRGTPDGDRGRVEATIAQILEGDPRSLDDLPSDAFEILREAYRAVWEGYEWGEDRAWEFWEAMHLTRWRRAPDSGLEAVEYIRGALLAEPEWLIERPRGFTWWPSAFGQKVWADPPFDDTENDLQVSTVHVTTDILTGVRDEVAFWNWVTRFGMVSVLGCTELTQDGTFRIHSRMELHEEIEGWGGRVLHYAALTQMKEAYEFGLVFMTGTGGPPEGHLVSGLAQHQHPKRGPREGFADAFTLAERGSWLVGSGEGQPAGLGEELLDTKDRWNLEFGLAPMAEAHDWGVRARVWWDRDTDDEEQYFANVDLLPSTHPRRGAGLIVHLNLPVWPDPQDAGYLNRLEGRGDSGTHTLGSWGMNPGTDTLTFGTFIPGPLLERSPGMSFNLLWRNAHRAEWARQALAGRRTR